MDIEIIGFEKHGPEIIFLTNDNKNRVYKLNLQNGIAFGLTGKTLKSPKIIEDQLIKIYNQNLFYKIIFSALEIKHSNALNVAESLFSYPELVSDNFITIRGFIRFICKNCNGKLPKGYVSWCREQDQLFSWNSCDNFIKYQAIQKWPENIRNFCIMYKRNNGQDIAYSTNYDLDLCISLQRIIKNSFKKYEIVNLINNITSIILQIQRIPALRSYLDDTKCASIALDILKKAYESYYNTLILDNETKIFSLNNKMVNGLIIKVPTALEDFVDEGQQQHNCVGHFYHNAIAQGKCLIYFLRKPGDPNHSFVTCRFDIETQKTVETRIKNNIPYQNEALFDIIDTLIKKILAE